MSDTRSNISPSSGKMRLADGSFVDVAVVVDSSKDPVNNIVQMTYPHAAVHRDTIVNATHYEGDGTGDFLYFFTVGDTLAAHLEYVVSAEGSCRVRFYEGPNVDTLGDSITTTRLNRDSTKTTEASVTQGGTVVDSDYGVLLKDQYNGGGGAGATVHGGSAVHDDVEFVLKLSTTYCLRLTRDVEQITAVDMEWYEVPQLPDAE